jgi:YggT family protein
MVFLVIVVQKVVQLFVAVLIIQAVLSFVMDPYHPVRQFFDRLVNPFLAPIRRYLPPIGGLDFSPMVLIVILYLLELILTRLLLLL